MASALLLAMGYNVLSMNATSLLKVKKAVRAISYVSACELLEEVMALESAGDVQRRMELVLRERGLAQFIHNPVA